VVILILFGSRKMPDAARSLGRSLRILKTEVKGLHDDEPQAQADQTGQTPAAQPAQLPAATPVMPAAAPTDPAATPATSTAAGDRPDTP